MRRGSPAGPGRTTGATAPLHPCPAPVRTRRAPPGRHRRSRNRRGAGPEAGHTPCCRRSRSRRNRERGRRSLPDLEGHRNLPQALHHSTRSPFGPPSRPGHTHGVRGAGRPGDPEEVHSPVVPGRRLRPGYLLPGARLDIGLGVDLEPPGLGVDPDAAPVPDPDPDVGVAAPACSARPSEILRPRKSPATPGRYATPATPGSRGGVSPVPRYRRRPLLLQWCSG
mmetsp:Transcript_54186/g.162236  ORF Transcript_54186/g.162236 Transcript_54186/m.162236 type:complete len:224 (+) Transcript_54186:681-1352(+)